MNARKWSPDDQSSDVFLTGDHRRGAEVSRHVLTGKSWQAEAWFDGRKMRDHPFETSADAQAVAEKWLDAFEAAPEPSDAKAARRVVLDIHRRMTAALNAARDAALEEWLAALEGTPAQAPAPEPEAFTVGAMEPASLDELVPKFDALKAGESLALLVTRREDGKAHVVWGPAAPVGTPASSGDPPSPPKTGQWKCGRCSGEVSVDSVGGKALELFGGSWTWHDEHGHPACWLHWCVGWAGFPADRIKEEAP